MPTLRTVDEAISRRLQVVQWGVTIPKDERDHQLAEKIRPEYPGILYQWIQGSLEWQRDGLQPPAKVTEFTKEYLDGEDRLALWLEESTIKSPASFTTLEELFISWCNWCECQKMHPGGRKPFSKELEQRFGLEKIKSTKIGK